MKLPNFEKAIVAQEKITAYLLSSSHRDGRGKSACFARFGFTPDSWQALAEALLQHAARHEMTKTEVSPFGKRYVVEGELKTACGRAPLSACGMVYRDRRGNPTAGDSLPAQ